MIASRDSSHWARFSSRSTPKPPSSICELPSPVPNSTRPPEIRSSVATRSATRAGWLTAGGTWTIPWPRRIRLCAGWRRRGRPRGRWSASTPPGSGARPPRRSRSRAGRPAPPARERRPAALLVQLARRSGGADARRRGRTSRRASIVIGRRAAVGKGSPHGLHRGGDHRWRRPRASGRSFATAGAPGSPARRALLFVLYVVLPPITFFNLARVHFDADVGAGDRPRLPGPGARRRCSPGSSPRGRWACARPAVGSVICCTLVANTGYLGYPLVAALLGFDRLSEAVVYDVLVSGPGPARRRVLGRRRVRRARGRDSAAASGRVLHPQPAALRGGAGADRPRRARAGRPRRRLADRDRRHAPARLLRRRRGARRGGRRGRVPDSAAARRRRGGAVATAARRSRRRSSSCSPCR